MQVIDWLLEGDIIIQHLTNKYLLGRSFDHNNGGYIAKYLNLYDAAEQEWGGSIYSGKWTSSTYTLLELKYMEVHYDNPCYQNGTKKVLNGLWENHGKVSKYRYQDMCMSAMLLSLVCYGRINDFRTNEIIDYILSHQMDDGGWNCAWNSVHNRSAVGSVHTTISVLEALADYEKYGYDYRLAEIKHQAVLGQEYLLSRELFKSLKSGEVIHPDMITYRGLLILKHYDRSSYKIFAGNEDLQVFLKRNTDKSCEDMKPVFRVEEYKSIQIHKYEN